jgi:hypothetical protein
VKPVRNVETRLRGLCNDGETLHGYTKVDETDEGAYYVVVREWPHPEVEDARTLSERYAYLTHGGGSDGWVENGINRRDTFESGELARSLAQMYAGIAARQDRGNAEREPITDELGE